jgi:hypothetical protein
MSGFLKKNFVTTNGQPSATLSRIMTPSPLIPAKAGIQEQLRALHGIEASRRNKLRLPPWVPTFVGTSGTMS